MLVYIVENWEGEYSSAWLELQAVFSTEEAAIQFMYDRSRPR